MNDTVKDRFHYVRCGANAKNDKLVICSNADNCTVVKPFADRLSRIGHKLRGVVTLRVAGMASDKNAQD